jgi:hypothetical protein
MDPQVKRNKKADKAKKNFEMTGGLSQKHVRLREALLEQKGAPPSAPSIKATKTNTSRR